MRWGGQCSGGGRSPQVEHGQLLHCKPPWLRRLEQQSGDTSEGGYSAAAASSQAAAAAASAAAQPPPGPVLDPVLAVALQSALEALEAADVAACTASRGVRSQERVLASAEAAEAVRQAVQQQQEQQQQAWAREADGSAAQAELSAQDAGALRRELAGEQERGAALAAKLAVAEAERRQQVRRLGGCRGGSGAEGVPSVRCALLHFGALSSCM